MALAQRAVAKRLRETLRDDHDFTVDVGHLTVFGTCASGCDS